MQIRLSRGLKFIIAIIILVVLMYMQNISLASSPIYAGVAKLRETGVGYRIGEKDIWKLISYTDTSGSNYLDDALYCVKAGVGFTYTGSGNVRTYDASYNLKTEKNKIAELSTADYSSIATNPHYNNILWILDNIYIPNESTAEDRAALLSAAGIDTDYNPGFALFPLTDDEIEVVQQMAIWYYTNYDDPDYHKKPEQFYNQLKFTTNGTEYKNLSTYNQNSTGEGPIKAEQMRLLYEHFINTSEANASIYDGTTNEIAPVEVITDNINITKSGTDYLAGPINIKKNNDNLYNINIQVTDENNVDITSKISFVDRSGRPVTNFVGNEFYAKVPANLTSRVNVDIQIAYNSTTSTLWVSNTSFVEQPLVKIEKTENNIITKLSVEIPEETEVSVEKVWNDEDNQDGVRPGSIEVQLYKNGTSMGAEYKTTLSGNTWSHTWENLAKKENGVDIEYSVKELNSTGEAVEEGAAYDANYTATYEVAGNTTTITNTHMPETTKVSVEKVWNDEGNQDGVRPGSIEVQLYKNGASMGEEYKATLSENTWSHTWENLAKKENGVDIEYSVKELNATGAAVEEGTAYDANYTATYEVAGNTTTITNTHMPETTKVSVEKVWNDEGNQDGVRPGSIEVQLYKNGASMGEEYKATLSENTWSHTWENLAKKENGVDIEYSVKELNATGAAVEEGTAYDANYTATYEIASNTTTITNTHIPEITKVSVEKVWEDVDNQDGVRPGSVEVQLYKNGASMGVEYKATLSENTWSHTWESLPKKENGVDIEYSVKELNSTGEAVEEGAAYDANYTATYEIASNTTTITNTHIPEQPEEPKEFDLSLRKFISAIDGVSPEVSREPQVDITYLADGTATTAIYNHTKEPLKVNKNSKIVYTIRVYNEGEVAGYASKIVDHLPEWLELVPESEINAQYGWQVGEDGRTIETSYLENELLQAFNGENLDYRDVQIECQIKETAVAETNMTNIAEITKYENENHEEVQPDRDSTSDSLTDEETPDQLPSDEDLPNYKDEETDKPYVPGQEDDDDFEKIYIEEQEQPEEPKEFDLSLRKFISAVDGQEPEVSREPQVDITYLADGTATTAIYNHTKEPLKVNKNSKIVYTIRVYNEGEVAGYASKIVDHLPEWLELVPESEINAQYGWQVGEDGRTIETSYLENELLQAFNGENLDYRDVQIECQIKETAVAETNMTNIAEITKYENENHEEVQPDRDSTSESLTDEETPDQLPTDEELPNYKGEETDKPYVPGQEDDDDFEKIYIEEPKEPETPPEEPETPPEEPEIFDLSLLKYVTQVIVTEDGVQKVTETGNVGDENDIIPKVEIHKKKLSTTEVKFAYTIKITNEGDIPGYAKEISDDIPEGLEFVPEDNPQWILGEDGWIHTRALENTLLQPGESTTVKVIFKWINSGNNLGIKTNTAEITEDYNDKDVPDIDSTPGNKAPGEDDIDIAEVLLSISTGRAQTYFVLGTAVLITLASGIAIIRKFVI